jgi:hypothetical protein
MESNISSPRSRNALLATSILLYPLPQNNQKTIEPQSKTTRHHLSLSLLLELTTLTTMESGHETRAVGDARELPEPALIIHPSPRQDWTLSGYPVVDGKYLDGASGAIKTVGIKEEFISGPPSLDIYWHNRMLTGRDDQFFGFGVSGFVDVTEYVRRMGNFLARGSCVIMALNMTKFAVNVTVATELSRDEMRYWLKEYGLSPALPEFKDPAQ